jgi:hypothetical protein
MSMPEVASPRGLKVYCEVPQCEEAHRLRDMHNALVEIDVKLSALIGKLSPEFMEEVQDGYESPEAPYTDIGDRTIEDQINSLSKIVYDLQALTEALETIGFAHYAE